MNQSKVNICLVGAGRWGVNHLKTLSELNMLTGVVDTNSERVEQLKKTYPHTKFYQSLEDLNFDEFDGFVVATPAESHLEVGRQILNKRKPVLIEKPLALSSNEARILCELADEKDTLLMVGHVLLFHPAIILMKEMIDAGVIGKLQYLYSNRLNLGTVRTEENILWSFAPHDISLFQAFIGSEPEEVHSDGGAFVQQHLHDSTMTILRYSGNIVGHIFVSWLHPFKEHRLVIIGSRGMLQFEDSGTSKGLYFYDKGIDFIKGIPTTREGGVRKIEYDNTPPLRRELEAFAKGIGNKKIERASGWSGLRVLEILERASRSLNRPAALDSSVQSIVEGSDINSPTALNSNAFNQQVNLRK